MRISFVKMEGIANDFLVTHMVRAEDVDGIAEKASAICDRRRGVGADGIIFVLPATVPEAHVRMRIINSDGSEAEMCGNGVRCCAKYLLDQGLADRDECNIETLAGIIGTRIEHDGMVRVNMGKPRLSAASIPVLLEGAGRVVGETIAVDGRDFRFTAVSMGNPHCVIHVPEITDELVLGIGPIVEKHSLFPKKTNVEFIFVRNSSEIDMRVWERGCGETAACGTGACAAVVAGVLSGLHGNIITVHLPGGDLCIEWSGIEHDSVLMTGPARAVFSGLIDTDSF